MSGLPIRLRITLAFAGAMALVLTALGLFIYLRYADHLNEAFDQGLRSRQAELGALAVTSGAGLQTSGAQIDKQESFAQVLDADGRIVDTVPQLAGDPLLTGADLERATRATTFFNRDSVPGLEGHARLLAGPVQANGRTLVVVAGGSIDDRDESLANLRTILLIGGPVALLLASLAGYLVAGTAIRPIETALARERAFVDDASHELRTPLAMHKTELELALRYAKTPEEMRAALRSANEEVDRLVELAEDLLVLARSQDGKLALDLKRVGVRDVFDGVRERFTGRVESSGRELVVQDVDGLQVEGDRLRLDQALSNLVENAIQHGGGGITVHATHTDGRVALHVEDCGPGFPPEFIDRAFERFSRADPARSGGGTGLGLAIVEAIAHAHRGSAHVRNRDAGGADAWIEIPT